MASKNKKINIRKSNNSKKLSMTNKSTDNEHPVWSFDNIDRDGKFAFDVERSDFQHKEVIRKIIDYSSMTWSEIKRQTHDDGKSKHHFIVRDKLSKEANDRFSNKRLEEDSDSIFSFALQNKLRIVGIRRGKVFHVLWYDPNHEVCPSKKKHT